MPRFKIIIKKTEKPIEDNIDKEFNFICKALGFFEPIDKEKTAAKIFREILNATREEKPITSSILVEKIHMSRGSIINHLNNLMESGLIEKQGRIYRTRHKSLFFLMRELEKDVERIFKDLEESAVKIDRKKGFKVKIE